MTGALSGLVWGKGLGNGTPPATGLPWELREERRDAQHTG